jgi:hypothetical protein
LFELAIELGTEREKLLQAQPLPYNNWFGYAGSHEFGVRVIQRTLDPVQKSPDRYLGEQVDGLFMVAGV